MATAERTGSAARSATKRSGNSSSRASAAATGQRDEHYDVISVLYHALQAAETVQQYIADAKQAKDDELLSFFEETAEEYKARAAQAKELLAARLDEAGNGSEVEDEDEDEDE